MIVPLYHLLIFAGILFTLGLACVLGLHLAAARIPSRHFCGGTRPSIRRFAAWLMTIRSFGSLAASRATWAGVSGLPFTSSVRLWSISSFP